LPKLDRCGEIVAVAKKKTSVLEEFRGFILRGNVIDLAIAVAIGAAFTAVVTSLVAAFITPIIGAIFGKDFAQLHFTINGSKFQYGLFINALISFVITGTVLFFLVVKPMQTLLSPQCLTDIPVLAVRCQACTSELGPSWAPTTAE
jgi:large conductance mechanosensitive channel